MFCFAENGGFTAVSPLNTFFSEGLVFTSASGTSFTEYLQISMGIFCILLVFFFTVSEAQEEQPYIAVIDSTDLREENPFVSQEAKDALFKWSLKQSSGVYKKLMKSEKSSTVGKDTSIRVWLQDTDCPILEKKLSSYADIEAKCNGMSQSKDCTIRFKNPDMKKVSLTCITRKDVRPTQQSGILVDDSADRKKEYPSVAQQAKDALLKWSLKQSSGVYKKLIKSEKSSTVGTDTSIRVWLQDTDCPILAKKFSSYNDIEAQCNGIGQSEDCTIQFKNPDMAKVTLTCIVRKDVKPEPSLTVILYYRAAKIWMEQVHMYYSAVAIRYL
ncbi:hypothetical protein T01_12116 [Trichinella spiralis]|uniref:Uncharacterized protein n=1 Tax=Trichinella spiralis TaxID=6334 RepID=A0A0V1BZ64_TRISP|nr:hypothetical protein T01_12116 [Trichinella spiralis]